MSVRSLLSTIFGSSRKTTTASTDLSKRLEGKNRSLTYGEWVSRYGENETGDKLKSARTKLAKSDPDYGAAAETLSDRGLSETGYASYLRERNKAAYRAVKEKADAAGEERAKNDRSGYLSYLENWEAEQDKLMQKTLTALSESKTSGIDAAYADALSAGLTDERARIVSRLAPSVARYGMRRLREGVAGVLYVSVTAGLSGAEAELLARACGISRADAEKLRQTVDTSFTGKTVVGTDRWE